MTFQDTIRANIEEIRNRVGDFLIDTCVLRRKTGENVISGESIPIYADGVTLACRLIIRSGSESNNVAAQERAIAQGIFTGIYRMQLPHGTEISVDDRIDYIDTQTSIERTFEVVFVPPHNTYTGAFVIGLREVQ